MLTLVYQFYTITSIIAGKERCVHVKLDLKLTNGSDSWEVLLDWEINIRNLTERKNILNAHLINSRYLETGIA